MWSSVAPFESCTRGSGMVSVALSMLAIRLCGDTDPYRGHLVRRPKPRHNTVRVAKQHFCAPQSDPDSVMPGCPEWD